MKYFVAHGLLVAVFAGFAVMWSPGRWAVTVPQVAVFALAIIWMLWARGISLSLFRCPALPVLGLLCYGTVQLLFHWSVYAWATQEALLYWFANFLALIIAMDVSRDPRMHSRLLNGLFWGGVALAILAVIQVFTSDGKAFWMFATPYHEDVYGTFLYKNQYAAFLELLLPIAMVRAFGGRGARWPYLIITAALYACAVASNSRAGLILASVELITVSSVLLWQQAVVPGRLARLAAAFLVTAGLLIAVVGPDVIWSRFQQHDPYSSRRDLLVSSLAMFREHPLKGFGLGTWPTAYPAYAIDDDGLFANQAHNDWAQAAVEAGVPGLLCLAAFFIWSIRAGWKTLWGIGISFVLIHALVDYPIQRQALALYCFILAGLEATAPKPKVFGALSR